MKTVIKSLFTAFLVGMFASPCPLGATATQLNWGTSIGSEYNTPGSPGTPGQVLVNTMPWGVDWSSAPVTLQSGGQSFVGAFFISTGTVITNTTGISTFSAANLSGTLFGSVTLPANYMVAGKSIRYTAMGTLSTPGAPLAQNAAFSVKFGTVTVGTTGTIPLPVGLSSMTFQMQGILTCIAPGSFVSGVSSTTTNFLVTVASGTTLVPGLTGAFVIGNSTTSLAQTNTTVANDLNLTVQYQTASVGNVLVINSLVYENLN